VTPAWLPMHQPVRLGHRLQTFNPPIQRIELHLRESSCGPRHLQMILPVTLLRKPYGTLKCLSLNSQWRHGLPERPCRGASSMTSSTVFRHRPRVWSYRYRTHTSRSPQPAASFLVPACRGAMSGVFPPWPWGAARSFQPEDDCPDPIKSTCDLRQRLEVFRKSLVHALRIVDAHRHAAQRHQ